MPASGRFLLDTNIAIALLEGNDEVLSSLDLASEVHVSAVVVGELFFGAAKSSRPAENTAKVERFAAGGAVGRSVVKGKHCGGNLRSVWPSRFPEAAVYYGQGRGVVIGLLESERHAIEDVCSRFGVARLEVFGSALRDDCKADESDLDLLVEFKPMESYARVEAYFGLRDELRALLKREIDLVMVDAVKNPYFSRDIERTKQLLYAA